MFAPIGMRTRVTEPDAWVVNTCAGNDTAEVGDDMRWVFSNPTNRAITHRYAGIRAVSTEAMWQGTKIRAGATGPDPITLGGDWRRGKGKRPVGAWAGPDQPLITSPGQARRAIYLPCFRAQIEHWLIVSEVADRIERARNHPGTVYLRDFDTGQGIDRNGPMSHAWLLSIWLNTGEWPA